jgi:multidrug efflux pump subunit AcrA (membrane-fusion protein)
VDGVVTSLPVAAGDTVEAGRVLAVVSEPVVSEPVVSEPGGEPS